MKLFDCFMYNNEDLLLDLRLNVLDQHVDQFIIIESLFDHQGNKKKLNFRLENYSKFQKKIKYIVLDSFPKNLTSWQKENYNRNYITNGLEDAKPDDYIMISDLDEIPKIEDKTIFGKKKYTVFTQKMFYYKFNLHNITEPNWMGTRVCKKKYLKSPQWIRNQKIKKYPVWRIKRYIQKFQWNIIEDGGWHFSFVMSNMDIKKKIESFAHSEFNKSEFIDILNIEKNINLRKDLFGRPFKFIKIKDEKQLPKHLLLNKKKYKNLLA
jgi:beta-1,4-mannosyl-glycoprotein beta-1,4-N-acetylglucosaminyltransferase